MNMQMYVHIGLLYFVKKNEITYFDSLVLNIFLRKLKNLLKSFLELKI